MPWSKDEFESEHRVMDRLKSRMSRADKTAYLRELAAAAPAWLERLKKDATELLCEIEKNPPTPGQDVPTPEEMGSALLLAARLAVFKRWRGKPGRNRTFRDLIEQVAADAVRRARKFRHGGKYTLFEYCYVACSFAMIDIANEDVARWRAQGQEVGECPEDFVTASSHSRVLTPREADAAARHDFSAFHPPAPAG
jgi:hypothetical protein